MLNVQAIESQNRAFNLLNPGLEQQEMVVAASVFATASAKLVQMDRRAQQVVVVWIRRTWPIRTHKK